MRHFLMPFVALTVLARLTNVAAAQQPSYATLGKWESEFNWHMRGMYLILLRDGTVLSLDEAAQPPLPENQNVVLFQTAMGLVETSVPQMPRIAGEQWDMHCSGHSALGDGRILIVGGGEGFGDNWMTFLYDPAQPQQMWQQRRADDLPPPYSNPGGDPQPRWYPTCTTLANAKVLISGGRDGALCDLPPQNPNGPNAEANRMIQFDITKPAGSQYQYLETAFINRDLVYYPFMFLLRNGDVAMMGGDEFGFQFCPNPHTTTYFKPSLAVWTDGPNYAHYGTSAAMYRPGCIVKIGAGQYDGSGTSCNSEPHKGAWKFNSDLANHFWVDLPCSTYSHSRGQLVVLPDRNVIAMGGWSHRTPEMIDPDATTPMWSALAEYATVRAYHSAAILLPSAEVLFAGGQSSGNPPTLVTTGQIFKPPYLFDSSGNPAARPVISQPTANSEIEYGGGFDIVLGGAYADQIARVVLMRPGAATHGYDQDARRVPLEFILTGANKLKAAAPAHGNIAPPGYYMLFVLQLGDRPNIFYPSVATWVKLK